MHQWSEEVILKEWSDDSSWVYLVVEDPSNGSILSLRMKKESYYPYDDVIKRLKGISLPASIKYQTLLSSKKGDWSTNEWFSDVSIINTTESVLGGRDKASLEELIEMGEGKRLEFKSSFLWGISGDKKKGIAVIMKTIAAFNNSYDGGTLLIGVNDIGRVVGLKKDYKLLGEEKNDKDGFELRLIESINSEFGKNFLPTYVTVSFPTDNFKEVCMIKVKPGNEPTYINMCDKHGKILKKYYVRSGNSSQDITDIEAILKYCKDRY
jgi:hypothetical protein